MNSTERQTVEIMEPMNMGVEVSSIPTLSAILPEEDGGTGFIDTVLTQDLAESWSESDRNVRFPKAVKTSGTDTGHDRN
jgi:hypothetical protein